MPKKKRVYLSGGMEYAKDEGADWRLKLESWLKLELGDSVFNPNKESEKYLSKALPNIDFRQLKSSDIEQYKKNVQKFVDIDSKEIAIKSDYVICLWDKSAQKGAGTKGELTIARYFRKPVYLVTTIKPTNIPGWVLGCTNRIFKTFDELKVYLKSIQANNHKGSK